MVLGLILLLDCTTSKTWLKNAIHFPFWNRILAQVCFYKSTLFYWVLPTRRLKQLLFGVPTAEILKRTSLDVYFSICKSQDHAINRQWIIQPKLIDYPFDTFLKFRNSPTRSMFIQCFSNGCIFQMCPIYYIFRMCYCQDIFSSFINVTFFAIVQTCTRDTYLRVHVLYAPWFCNVCQRASVH